MTVIRKVCLKPRKKFRLRRCKNERASMLCLGTFPMRERRLSRVAVASMRPFLYLNKLITGTCCHSLSVKVIRHIMDEIFVFCINALGFKHCTCCAVSQKLRTFKLPVPWLRHHHWMDHR